jgi:hypothetical protein
MDLGEPEHVEAPAVGGLDLLEPLREGVGVGLPFDLPVKFVIPAEFHVPPFPAPEAKPRAGVAIQQMPKIDPAYNAAA